MQSRRTQFEAALFVLALVLALVGGFAIREEWVANTFFFAAWCAALLLLFSLALRLPLHLRGRSAPLATAGVIVAAVGVALLANIALYRHDVFFDLTETGSFTPPPELQTVADSLDRDVSLTYFYNGQDGDALQAKNTLASLARRAPHLRVRLLDLDNEPVAARNYGVRIYNTAVIEAEGRRTQVDNSTDLRDMAFGIERVLKQQTSVVCFVTGHGEPYGAPGQHAHLSHTETLEGPVAVLEAPPTGINRLTMAIEAIGYSDRAVALPAVSDIPADCAVVADLGPRSTYSPDEVRTLKNYLVRGGRLLLMYDPEFPVAPDLQSLLGDGGLEVGSGMVLDPVNHSGTDEDKVAVPYYPPHPITDEVALTVFPGPRPIALLRKIPGIEATALASSSQQSYVRPIAAPTAFASTQPAAPPEPKVAEGHGQQALAVALQGNWPGGEQKPFRLVLVGSASFATNAFFPYASNGDLAVSMIRWLADDRAAQTETRHVQHGRGPAHASPDATHVLPDRNPAAALGDRVRRRNVAAAPMNGSAVRFVGIAGAFVMIALIGAISLTGRWPTGEVISPAPEHQGILTAPADQVARIQASIGGKDVVFQHRPEGGWLVNGVETEKALSAHVDAALRMLNVTNPPRILKPGDYTAAQEAEFGLDPPRLLVSVVAKTGKTSSAAFGETTPAQNAQYVRVIGQPNIYLVSHYVGVEWELAIDMAQRLVPAGVSDRNAAQRPGALLLPMSMATIAAVEIVENGTLTRFERDPEGDWFHHVGQHTHGPGGMPAHKADPRLAPPLAAEFTALERTSIEAVVAQHPDPDMLAKFGLEHPPSILLLYTRDSSRSVARVEFGKPTPDGLGRYARVRETDTVVMVPSDTAAHIENLLQLAGTRS